ncbi:hypothetical protein Lmor_1191 [Legionella moravica]|uniref:Uncharacterized protein n=1 Tax=Legionella moravica TaxID=39962 RepID=A0A378JRN7_9GAMM|nr:hypothetical protein [Legionella moravica]KTD34658.1 hypothetical protein Lmor_1191 [Legionella moravica]STX61264.1 Uncharacterised protein [Legionella moravica]
MKCFKHFDTDAVCASEIYVGRNSEGEIREIRPVCQNCLSEEQKRIDDLNRSGKKILIGFLVFFIVFILLLLR